MNRKQLNCGCCGAYFKTWPEYTDQDQDKGFGICQPCQTWISDRNKRELDKIAAIVREGLNATNQAKYDRLSTDKKRYLAMQAVEDGMITWTIGSNSAPVKLGA